MNETWIILGATSGMARALARKLAARGDALILAARDTVELETLAADAKLRGARAVSTHCMDLRHSASFAPIIAEAEGCDGMINAAVFAGAMPAQVELDADPTLMDGMVADNHTGPATFLHMFIPLLEARGCGTVVGVSSVAGDRGRLGNYAYGAAKAAFATYLSGLRNRLGRADVHVVTVKPGMVDTAMTWGLDGLVMLAQPEKVADDILHAVRKRRNVIYTPTIWAVVMTIIRMIPEPIFKRLKI